MKRIYTPSQLELKLKECLGEKELDVTTLSKLSGIRRLTVSYYIKESPLFTIREAPSTGPRRFKYMVSVSKDPLPMYNTLNVPPAKCRRVFQSQPKANPMKLSIIFLPNCPCCDSPDITIYYQASDQMIYLQCEACGYKTPGDQRRELAVENWINSCPKSIKGGE